MLSTKTFNSIFQSGKAGQSIATMPLKCTKFSIKTRESFLVLKCDKKIC